MLQMQYLKAAPQKEKFVLCSLFKAHLRNCDCTCNYIFSTNNHKEISVIYNQKV